MSEFRHGPETDLKAEQEKILKTPVMKANLILKSMYVTMDIIYGKKRTLPKFKVIEILARYPYWAWELGSYHKLSRLYCRSRRPDSKTERTAWRHIEMGRADQDNEQWHMMIITEIMKQKGIKQGFLYGRLIPRCMALGYLIITRVMYRLKPEWTFAMNARFESHAEHEYMKLVSEHPEWEDEPVETEYFDHYPAQKTMADLFRRIGLDEQEHMLQSMEEYERLTGRRML